MNRFAREGVGAKREAVPRFAEVGIVREDVACDCPELLVEAIKGVKTRHPYLLDNLLIEVIEELLARVALAECDLFPELVLQFIELKLDLLWSPALLVDISDAAFEVNPRLDRAKNFVAGAENTVEQLELLLKKFVHALVRRVSLV